MTMIKFKPRNRKTSMKKSSSRAHLQHSCDRTMGSFYLIPKQTSKPRHCGQDVHFLCREKLTLGVADEVGGWLKKATEIVVPVESRDVVVGTDGLLDNMFPYEIEEILSRTQEDKNVAKLVN
ncbi:hypothetical protein Ddye_009393 [Dipteronia dyeriana]|uniref:Protein phosphatase n=1 Tax=Dipteronia dyeriana TaxID=168575 RepID=A0AAD9XBA4_9ROSI|nr:hypothetical protein Ddye_009393 [Dipteronia dyeriana]